MLDRVVALLDPRDADEHQRGAQALKEAQKLQEDMVAPRLTAVYLQNASMGAWLGGALAVAIEKSLLLLG